MYKLEESLPNLGGTARKIAIYILKNPSKIAWFTAKELAEQAHVSQSAISRFYKYYNISSYNELKIKISSELATQQEELTKGFATDNFKNNIPLNLLNQIKLSLNDTESAVDLDDMIRAAKLIYDAEQIMCAGVGASYLVAEDLTQKLLRIQKRVFSHYDNDLKKVAVAQYSEKDLLILVSYSGKKREILELAEIARERNVPVISISRIGKTELSKISDITLQVASFEREYRISALSSRISSLYLVDVLFYTFSLFFQVEAAEKLRKTYDIINKLI